MILILDTHILLWALDSPDRLPPEIRDHLEAPGNEVYFSAASIWEIAIKTALGKADFRYSPEEIARCARETGFAELPITSSHGARVASLPPSPPRPVRPPADHPGFADASTVAHRR